MKDQSFILRRGPRNLTRLVAFLSSLANDKEFKVSIGLVGKDRSLEQNAALYGVAYKALSDFTGHTGPELHDHFLRAYFGEVDYEVLGVWHKRPRRTTTTDEAGNRKLLTTVEFADFYRFLQQQGAEMGCWVPDPDPMWHLHAEERHANAA